jgi:hypothetical protein
MENVLLKLITKGHLINANVNDIVHVFTTQFVSFSCGGTEGSNGAGRKK